MEGNNFTESMKIQLCEDASVGAQETQGLGASAHEEAFSNTHLIVGEDYKITGGKYKKFKTGVLQSINKTYSDVKVITDHPIDGIKVDKVIKVKNTYLMRLNPPGIEMPDESDLLNVPDLDEYMKNHPALEGGDIMIEEQVLLDAPLTEDPPSCQRCELFCKIKSLEEQLNNERMFSQMLLDKITK